MIFSTTERQYLANMLNRELARVRKFRSMSNVKKQHTLEMLQSMKDRIEKG